MAENARELGLDYEPAPVQEPIGYFTVNGYDMWEQIDDTSGKPLYEHPVAQTAVQEKCFLCGERVASCTSDVCPKSAQPAVQEGRDWSLLEATQESLREHMAEIKRLKAAQPVPVMTDEKGRPLSFWGGKSVEPIAQPAPVQEPVAWMYESVCGNDFAIRHDPPDYAKNIRPLYTTPPAPPPVPVKTYSGGKPWPVAPKPWVGLSEEEVEAYDDWADFQVGCGRQTLFDMVRDIDAKLKGKNHG
jgi:hypothetical protein